MVFPKKSARKASKASKAPVSCAGLPVIGDSLHDSAGRTVAHGFRQAGCFRHFTWSAGDKRDDILFYALRIGERPVSHPESESSGLGPLTGGVSQVVKTAQSRERTERTLFTW
jgi:hypothetical protein